MADNMNEQLLKILTTSNRALSLSEIQGMITPTIPERTLRRWLSQLADQKIIIKLGSRRDAKYAFVSNQPEPENHMLFSQQAQVSIQYEITLSAIQGFDISRVKYRALRRETIRYIILNKIKGQDIMQIVQKTIIALPVEDQNKFQEDTLIDLREMAPHRIAGLGISEQELTDWLGMMPLEGLQSI